MFRSLASLFSSSTTAMTRAQGVIKKTVGEPALEKNALTTSANVVGLGKLVDAQTHILTAIQSSISVIVEQHARAQDRHAQTLATRHRLRALPSRGQNISHTQLLPAQYYIERSSQLVCRRQLVIITQTRERPRGAHRFEPRQAAQGVSAARTPSTAFPGYQTRRSPAS
ncbi:unnamed protein product [Peniophora sp. CBMAI 1063]|nr:unnamed protein product [Peniophora sp. CBMAI 1063]